MKTFIYRKPVKIFNIFLLFILIAAFLISGFMTIAMASFSFYNGSSEVSLNSMYERISYSYGNDIINAYLYPSYSFYGNSYWKLPEDNNIMYTIDYCTSTGTGISGTATDMKRTTEYTTFDEDIPYSHSFKLYNYHYATNDYNDVYQTSSHWYDVTIFVKQNLSANDRYKTASDFNRSFYPVRVIPIIVLASSAVLVLVFGAIFILSAGRNTEKELKITFIERIPLEIPIILMILCCCIVIAPLSLYGIPEIIATSVIAYIAIFASGMLLIHTFAVRFKNGKWWRTLLIYKPFGFCWRIIRYLWDKVLFGVRNISLVWKGVAVWGALSFFEMIAVFVNARDGFYVFLWFAYKAVTSVVFIVVLVNMQKLSDGAKAIKSGNLDAKIDTQSLNWEFKKHGETLNNISEGLSEAVDEKMKSERMKTELITNVSHDIKTPLTSLISYIDLMKKENVDNETVLGYLEVLDRQSAKLNKLVNDLVEASKATSGNLKVELVKTDLSTLLGQAIGEYSEKMKSEDLEMIVTIPEKEIYSNVDGKYLWRTFDNLFTNIHKYTQPGTRVYVDLYTKSGRAFIVFKNTSKYLLNIPSEELMERFVRGDSSRNTEGSGLGLSIAKSLVELQGGAFEIAIDGDLFKSIIEFPVSEEE